MSTETVEPYGESYYTELARLNEAQDRAAQTYTSQMLYMREGLYMRDDGVRQRAADEAAQEWLRLDAKINALNSAEYAKKDHARLSGEGGRVKR